MGHSILVFVSHSSEDKATRIEPLVRDLEDCYINVWLDKRKIVPGDNLRKSIFRDGLDKADVALIFFTENSLKSSWVDREIKHVLRDEHARGNDFDLRKIISIFDSDDTYKAISGRYPELTDDLLHLMPKDYSSVQLGQLVSAIWSKYLSLQGGDVATQRQLLEKDREIFRKEQQLAELRQEVDQLRSNNPASKQDEEFRAILESGTIDELIHSRNYLLAKPYAEFKGLPNASEARAFGLIEPWEKNSSLASLTERGQAFFQWLLLNTPRTPSAF
ncbi:MAG: toll/interleukin-1 receptor domain-containing protein [Sulfuritalea sp.]|nr:toll/interleukin-1 receptor domain-containing protein [Sulfuritalea sp.]